MKTMGYKGMAIVLFSMFAIGVSAQNVLTLKVKNVPSVKGKLMVATDKGQYNMVDAAVGDVVLELKDVPAGKCQIYVYHDENGNYQLDKENGVPVEYCAIVDWEVKEDALTVEVPLVDVRKKTKK
ncbi:MAG: DUF2141 domain-containing protein [Bacteroides sp.]|uniref:DUF2141 domain-containing protein n=1 Tax=Bacteroides sp. TaxID=29523 RepID=UPI0026DEF40A|nr:DUF2141 domain-containing protein [Bacteroides sp.]MDO5419056.1 DUF2141 domain-containing protein [Bacteroides sp.]